VQLVMAGIACILGSIAGAGVPGAAVIYVVVAPSLQVLGAPLAIIPLYIAVIALADPIITMATVSADLTAATVVRRLINV
jgi:Na+/H+-dicarboxylate symporter